MGWRAVRWPQGVDALLACGLAAVGVLQGLDDATGRWRPFDLTAVLLTALATLPTAVRRRAPVAVLLVCCSFWIGQIALGYSPVVTTYGPLLALFTVAATQPRWLAVCSCALGSGIWIVSGLATHFASPAGVVLTGLAVPAVVGMVGDGAKQLALANARLARDREERARRAVTAERLRIARELHDVVAHHMSVVSVQAGLARYVLRADPATAETALSTVLTTSAEALDEMRRVLALLRAGEGDDPAADDPAPGLPGILALAQRVRAAGVPVEVEVAGEPRPLPSGMDLCVHRIVQESLTNVLKHAAPATASITLRYGDAELTATVRDDGARAPAAAAGGRTGQGLIGMRERALLYGGTLAAAPRPGGGFEVRLVLPLPAAPAREEGDDPAA
ncbi:sensor histidine kinase [Actinoplanes sp. URMC 104]|uniref:sensor histidine kinase n=1 Tax=Actinoplanes sp. URMC 104 TaxID=3423409 RepID=UPI003F19F442